MANKYTTAIYYDKVFSPLLWTHLLRTKLGEQIPEFGNIRSHSNVRVQHNDLVEGGWQGFVEGELHETKHTRVVLVGDPGDVWGQVVCQVKAHFHCGEYRSQITENIDSKSCGK